LASIELPQPGVSQKRKRGSGRGVESEREVIRFFMISQHPASRLVMMPGDSERAWVNAPPKPTCIAMAFGFR
jgi:hypothetical protein